MDDLNDCANLEWRTRLWHLVGEDEEKAPSIRHFDSPLAVALFPYWGPWLGTDKKINSAETLLVLQNLATETRFVFKDGTHKTFHKSKKKIFWECNLEFVVWEIWSVVLFLMRISSGFRATIFRKAGEIVWVVCDVVRSTRIKKPLPRSLRGSHHVIERRSWCWNSFSFRNQDNWRHSFVLLLGFKLIEVAKFLSLSRWIRSPGVSIWLLVWFHLVLFYIHLQDPLMLARLSHLQVLWCLAKARSSLVSCSSYITKVFGYGSELSPSWTVQEQLHCHYIPPSGFCEKHFLP